MNLIDNIIALDREIVLAVNSWHTPFWDRFFWMLSETAVWLPAALALMIILIRNKRLESLWIMLVAALMFVFVDQVAAEIIKPLVGRPRPTHDMMLIPFLETVNGYRGGNYGFLSNHAANVFAFACFSALLFKHAPYSLSIFAWAGLVSFSRLYLGVHFLGDILAGAIFGILSGLAFYAICQLFTSGQKVGYNINKYQYTKSFYKKKDIFVVLIILATILTTLLITAHYLY